MVQKRKKILKDLKPPTPTCHKYIDAISHPHLLIHQLQTGKKQTHLQTLQYKEGKGVTLSTSFDTLDEINKTAEDMEVRGKKNKIFSQSFFFSTDLSPWRSLASETEKMAVCE